MSYLLVWTDSENVKIIKKTTFIKATIKKKAFINAKNPNHKLKLINASKPAP